MRPRSGQSPVVLLVLFVVLAVLVIAIGRYGLRTAAEGPPAVSSSTPTVRVTVAPAGTAAPTAPRRAGRSPAPAPSATRAALEPTVSGQPTSPPAIEPATQPPSLATAAPSREPSPVPTPQPARYYTAAAGDTLWGISRKFGITVDQLARANGLSADSQLRIGQRLLIPQAGAESGIALPPVGSLPPSPARSELSQLSPALVRFLNSRRGTTAVAVYVPEENRVYSLRPRVKFAMASTVKVPIMVTQLTQQFRRNPAASTGGSELLVPMITVSENGAATALLAQVGGPPAVESEMRSRGLESTDISSEAWGLSTTTTQDMVTLIRSLYYGQRLNAGLRGTAFGLMSGIVAEQRWGVPKGLGDDTPIAFKGGWLPLDDGWLVHQVGVFRLGGRNYIFAMYSSEQPTFDYGKETLRRSAELLAGELAKR